MKLNKYINFLFIALFAMTSCSDDNDSDTSNSGDPDTTASGNYFPSTINDFWNYDVVNTDNVTDESVESTDNIYVASATGTTFNLEANNDTVANGTMNGLLTTTELSRTDTELTIDGTMELPAEISDLIEFEILLDNVKLYKLNASNGTQLSSSTNTAQQDFNGFPVTITYVITTKALGASDSMSLNGETYNDVITSSLKVNLKVSTVVTILGSPTPINILDPQDVLSITNYFAKDIGLVRSEADSDFNVSDIAITALELADVDLDGIPTSGSSTNIQELTDFSVAE